MITGIEIRADLDVLEAIDDQIRRTPALMNTAYKRQLQNSKRRFLIQLQNTEPGRPHYPIRWKSERQRRAFFATNGFGQGIPTRRTGNLINSYDLIVSGDDDGGQLILSNDDPAARYVIGDDQQPFHIDTGWEFIGFTANRLQDELTDDLIEIWYTVADPFGGVPL